uniref:Uncharacterized protein n=1 Tax=Branchiostoma floridae TaxID=7739 RepID=C3YES2_BRAFL|eukprot:XP_002605156.1 hypothetical protein BRAFLDRAFT_80908 [Branchiostoma floridae]
MTPPPCISHQQMPVFYLPQYNIPQIISAIGSAGGELRKCELWIHDPVLAGRYGSHPSHGITGLALRRADKAGSAGPAKWTNDSISRGSEQHQGWYTWTTSSVYTGYNIRGGIHGLHHQYTRATTSGVVYMDYIISIHGLQHQGWYTWTTSSVYTGYNIRGGPHNTRGETLDTTDCVLVPYVKTSWLCFTTWTSQYIESGCRQGRDALFRALYQNIVVVLHYLVRSKPCHLLFSRQEDLTVHIILLSTGERCYKQVGFVVVQYLVRLKPFSLLPSRQEDLTVHIILLSTGERCYKQVGFVVVHYLVRLKPFSLLPCRQEDLTVHIILLSTGERCGGLPPLSLIGATSALSRRLDPC